MGHYYRFRRGDRVVIVSGQRAGVLGVVDSAVFQRSIDHPDDLAPGYHLVLSEGSVVTVRWDQVEKIGGGSEGPAYRDGLGPR